MAVTLTTPAPFTEAEDHLTSKVEVPTPMSARELMEDLSPDVRERAFFSARVTNAQILAEFKKSTQAIVAGESNIAEQRLRLKQLLRTLDYRPEEGKAGGLQDLSSNVRLNLMLKMNVSMVRNYGQWRQMNRPEALLASPALELVRVSPRVNRRWWAQRWNQAAASLGDTTTATEASGSPQYNEINAYALKNDPIWPAISAFGIPYPPFDYNSGMGLREVGYREACEIGVMVPGGKPLEPPPLRLNTGLTSSLAGLGVGLLSALAQFLGPDVQIDGDTASFANELRERGEMLLHLMNDGTSEGGYKGWQTRRQRIFLSRTIRCGRMALRHVLKNGSDARDAIHVRGIGPVDFVHGRPGTTRDGKEDDGYGIAHIEAQHPEALRTLPRTLALGRSYAHHAGPHKRFVVHRDHVAVLTRHAGRWTVTTHYADARQARKIEGEARWGLPNTSQVSPGILTTGTTLPVQLSDAVRGGCCQDPQVKSLRGRGQAVLHHLEEAACS